MQVERCIHLLNKFSPKIFETKPLGASCATQDIRELKFGRGPKLNEQLLELPINQQMYDLIDEKGTEGVVGIEVGLIFFLLCQSICCFLSPTILSAAHSLDVLKQYS